MRSVVVVLPASMCAMIPMFRVLASWALFSAMSLPLKPVVRVCARRAAASRGSPGGGSPAVVREGLVRLGHLVRVLAPLHCGTQTVARVEQLVHQPLGHGLLAAGAAVLDQPAQPQGGAA